MTVSIPARAARDLNHLARIRQLASSGEARRRRIEARLSQSEIAHVCGVSAALVSRWESGSRVPRGKPGVIYATVILGLSDAE